SSTPSASTPRRTVTCTQEPPAIRLSASSSIPTTPKSRRPPMEREIPLFTLDGVGDASVTCHDVFTEDKLGLSMLRFQRGVDGEAGEAVMILHGLTTSTDMYVMPEHYNLVSYLLDNGYNDVWCFDFRMSNRHSYNLFK